jgi:hypothetical protein
LATRFTAEDIPAIEKLLPSQPLLWTENPRQYPIRQFGDAYRPPTMVTSVLRREEAFHVSRRLDIRIQKPNGEWTVDQPFQWAHVAIPGRNFTQIDGDLDINQPFRVVDQFDVSVRVMLREKDRQGQAIILRKVGEDWIVVRLLRWAV